MGAECWQMTGLWSHLVHPLLTLPATTYRLNLHANRSPLLWISPSVLQLAQSFTLSIHLSVYLSIYHFVPLGSHVCSCSFGFLKNSPGSINVSLLCLSSVFLFATCWCLSIKRLCKLPLKGFSNWKDMDAHTRTHTHPVSRSTTEIQFKIPKSHCLRRPKISNILKVWGLAKYFCSPMKLDDPENQYMLLLLGF